MSNWLSVFGRDFGAPDPCIENLYGVCLDGVDDYLLNTGGTMQPTSTSSKQWVSVWVKDLDTAARNEGEFIFTQSVSGNNTADFWRIVYNTNNSSGTALNVITVEWRANGSGNRILKQYRLHDHTSITGSTGLTDFWLDGNTNINTLSNGYVHIFAIWDVPALGSNMLNGDVQLYWNGQLMNNPYNTSKLGTSQTSIYNNTNLYLGTNGYNTTGFWKGQLDEVFITNNSNGLIFMSDKGLSTNQDVVDYFYNTGCPGNIGSDGRWNFNWWRFENSWNADSGSNAWSPINGPTFGSFPNGCSFAAAAIACTENTYYGDFYHASTIPFTSSDSATIYNRITSNFGAGSGWNSVVGSVDGLMSWMMIGATVTSGGTTYATSTGDAYSGSDYWVRMKVLDGDGNTQNLPSVAGGTSAPNELVLEEKDTTTGALTGNSITFQVIRNASYLASNTEFVFKARITSQSGFGNSAPGFTFNPPTTSSGSHTGTYCTSWSSTTPIYIVDATNYYTTDFNY